MPVAAVLFDIGGPIDTEATYERLIHEHIQEALHRAGVPVTAEEFATANAKAIAAFAPNAYRAIIWTLTHCDTATTEAVYAEVAARGEERHRAAGGIELRPGIGELLRELRDRGLQLGLAANQPAATVLELDRLGLGSVFDHREVSGTHGLRKPDVRVFLRCLEDLGSTPGETVMVGDRVDNDIAPARLLGMRTVLLRTGRHGAQQPRSPDEVPDFEVTSVAELRAALRELLET